MELRRGYINILHKLLVIGWYRFSPNLMYFIVHDKAMVRHCHHERREFRG